MSKEEAALPIEKQRKRTFEQMTPATKELAETVGKLMARGAKGSIITQYDLGAHLAEVVENETKFGDNAIQLLADYFAIKGGATTLYDLITFATEFEKPYVEQASQQLMANGASLTIAHWFALCQLKSVAEREKALKRIMHHSLSANDFQLEIRAGASGGTKHTRQGGRKPRVASNPVVALQQTFQIAQKFKNFVKAAEKSVFDSFDELAPDKVNKDVLSRLENTLKTVTAARDSAENAVTRITKNIERCKKVLAKQPSANGKPPSSKGANKANKKKKKIKRLAEV